MGRYVEMLWVKPFVNLEAQFEHEIIIIAATIIIHVGRSTKLYK